MQPLVAVADRRSCRAAALDAAICKRAGPVNPTGPFLVWTTSPWTRSRDPSAQANPRTLAGHCWAIRFFLHYRAVVGAVAITKSRSTRNGRMPIWKCPTCGIVNADEICKYCTQAAQPSPPIQSGQQQPSKPLPQWLTPGRVWVILKLGIAALVMLGLTTVFGSMGEFSIAVYPFAGLLLCCAALGVFFWRWTKEVPK
jgi:hypothetical protein